jgi:hypothetical protein
MFRMGTFLRCSNARKVNGGKCWNHVQAPVADLQLQVLRWFQGLLVVNPEAYEKLLDATLSSLRQSEAQALSVNESRQREVNRLKQQQSNLAKAIAEGGDLTSLLKLLKDVERQLEDRRQADDALRGKSVISTTTMSREEVTASLESVLKHLMQTSADFGDVLREFFLDVKMHPMQALDCGQVRPRAILRYAGNAELSNSAPAIESLSLDLFAVPSHVRLMPEIMRIRNQVPRPTERWIGNSLGTSYMTVRRAVRYAALMAQEGLTEPFRMLTEEPSAASRWRDASHKTA